MKKYITSRKDEINIKLSDRDDEEKFTLYDFSKK